MNDELELVTLEQASATFRKTETEIHEYIRAGRIGKYDAHGNLIADEKNGSNLFYGEGIAIPGRMEPCPQKFILRLPFPFITL